MLLESFLTKLENTPSLVDFQETIHVIDNLYHFAPTRFMNGKLTNKAGQNSGSCKILAFCLLHELDEPTSLACFGAYFREDVLSNPSGTDHQNIRNFMRSGWKGIKFDKMPLKQKSTVAS